MSCVSISLNPLCTRLINCNLSSPFSVTISKDEVPRSYAGIPFDPQIYFGAQANGFYGNVRFKTFGATRVFFFQIQPGAQNMYNYYTIIVVVPWKKTKISPQEKGQLDIIMGLIYIQKKLVLEC